jgi:glycopeptide antibiotics resistance protein
LAIFGGLVLAVALFVPFVWVSYRRRGTMTLGRTATWVAGLVYFLAIWTYTLLPLPDPAAIRCLGYNLVPGEFIERIRDYDTSGLRALIHNPGVLEFAFNILLFTPLGFITRLLWRRGVVFTTLLGVGLSLLIELTQGTGVWGLYPCAYRYGEVDDLISNGTGALLGGLLSWPVARLVTFDDPVDPARLPTSVTAGRRLVGGLCDGLSLGLAVMALRLVVAAAEVLWLGRPPAEVAAQPSLPWLAAAIPIALGLVITLATGQTVGDWAVELRFARADGGAPLWSRCLRYAAGPGGWAALSAWHAPAGGLFALVAALAILATRDRRGLAGIAARLRPVLRQRAVPERPVNQTRPPAPGGG